MFLFPAPAGRPLLKKGVNPFCGIVQKQIARHHLAGDVVGCCERMIDIVPTLRGRSRTMLISGCWRFSENYTVPCTLSRVAQMNQIIIINLLADAADSKESGHTRPNVA
jgi:hypothetical protein